MLTAVLRIIWQLLYFAKIQSAACGLATGRWENSTERCKRVTLTTKAVQDVVTENYSEVMVIRLGILRTQKQATKFNLTHTLFTNLSTSGVAELLKPQTSRQYE